MNATAPIVSRVWSFCTKLRDDGGSYGDYLEQLIYLIFLKMADEYGRPPYSRKIGIPEDLGWASCQSGTFCPATRRQGQNVPSVFPSATR